VWERWVGEWVEGIQGNYWGKGFTTWVSWVRRGEMCLGEEGIV